MMSIKEIKDLLDEGKIVVLYKDEDGLLRQLVANSGKSFLFPLGFVSTQIREA